MSGHSPIPAIPEEEKEKDSLFSSEESEEKQIVTQVTEEASSEKKVEYSDEDLNKLVSYIKKMTILYNLLDSDWTESCEVAIKDWLVDASQPLLTIFFSSGLQCEIGVPDSPVSYLSYFLREPNQYFDVATFHNTIIFGTIDEDIEGSMLSIIRDVYGPLLTASENWPDSVKNEFCNQLQMFLLKVTDIHYKLDGLTVLYVPREILKIPIFEASKDRELVKRLEGIVVYWTKQVRVGLQDQDQNAPEELLCLKDEYEFWKYRYENLLGLNHQLDDKHIKHICNILALVQSTYVRQFRALAEEIIKNVEESKSNIEYLGVLVQPCEELENIFSPDKFPPKIPKILHLIRFIWLNSPFYNTSEKITQLCRSLSNQLILQCRRYIDLDVVFVEKKTRKPIKMFETCIDCMMKYIKTYVEICSKNNNKGCIHP